MDALLRAQQVATRETNPGFSEPTEALQILPGRITAGDGESGYTVEVLTPAGTVASTVTRVFPLAPVSLVYLPGQREPRMLVAQSEGDGVFVQGCLTAFSE